MNGDTIIGGRNITWHPPRIEKCSSCGKEFEYQYMMHGKNGLVCIRCQIKESLENRTNV